MPLKRYAYDPLDRLTTTTMGAQPSTQRFYHLERLSTARQGEHSQTIFQHHDQLLAEKHTTATLLLGTDLQRSVLHSLNGAHHYPRAYTPYGHHRGQQGLLGFNGEAHDPLTGHYLLGNGHRAYNPVLMRFNSPDTLSPFGAGGLNPYCYCLGDPVNRVDPNGQISFALIAPIVLSVIGLSGTAVGAIPSVGFYASFKALKAGPIKAVDLAKVAGVGFTASAGIVGTVRLSMAAEHNNTGSTEMTSVGIALAILGLSSSGLATKLGWSGIRAAARAKRVAKLMGKNSPPPRPPRNSISSTSSSTSPHFAKRITEENTSELPMPTLYVRDINTPPPGVLSWADRIRRA
ncbi:RHS repeat-associated core domain-containing protein [Pseudomonas sp. FSL R10-0399]|uniref:RHS repeat-associated core domain-containing protein n=1 Tax=Pseudomonas TaxID=286 RepID=UPI00069DF524|nr:MULTISPECIES: RHS repeat-associated core domain-containing protein [Pseudomonas]MQT60028.1 RHS repeat-associated core domain-containing protein [Pseudomonas sp. FSL R10-0399]